MSRDPNQPFWNNQNPKNIIKKLFKNQENPNNRLTFPLQDPSRPLFVKATADLTNDVSRQPLSLSRTYSSLHTTHLLVNPKTGFNGVCRPQHRGLIRPKIRHIFKAICFSLFLNICLGFWGVIPEWLIQIFGRIATFVGAFLELPNM